MSVQTQIDRISGAVQSALAALAEKGVTVPAGTKVDGLAALIAAIEAGGGSEVIDEIIKGTLTHVYSNTATEVGTSAFQGNRKILTVDLPAVTNISNYAFRGAMFLTTVNAPLVNKIGDSSFRECTALATVDTQNVNLIVDSAFYGCSQLTALILRSNTMATLKNKNVIQTSAIANGSGYIYVPAALVDTYKAGTNWSTYATQFRALEDYTVDGTTTGALDESKI